MVLRYKDIGEIIRLIDASACEELVLETDEIKIVVRRRGAGSVAPQTVGSSAVASPAQASSATPASIQAKPSVSPPLRVDTGAGIVSSPMVGIFYRAPSPDAPPFVEVGTRIEAGDPLCVIEVMKLFTTIHAEFGGTVKEIGAENAQFVEFGQMLFVIEPE